MDSNDYTFHRIEEKVVESTRLLQILKETLERRYAPDEAVDNCIDNLEIELTLLSSDLKRRK